MIDLGSFALGVGIGGLLWLLVLSHAHARYRRAAENVMAMQRAELHEEREKYDELRSYIIERGVVQK